MTTKQSLAARCRSLRHEIKGPDMGGKPRLCGCPRCTELLAIAAELERIAGEMRVPHQADPSDEQQAMEPFYSQQDVDAWAAALADPKEEGK